MTLKVATTLWMPLQHLLLSVYRALHLLLQFLQKLLKTRSKEQRGQLNKRLNISWSKRSDVGTLIYEWFFLLSPCLAPALKAQTFWYYSCTSSFLRKEDSEVTQHFHFSCPWWPVTSPFWMGPPDLSLLYLLMSQMHQLWKSLLQGHAS